MLGPEVTVSGTEADFLATDGVCPVNQCRSSGQLRLGKHGVIIGVMDAITRIRQRRDAGKITCATLRTVDREDYLARADRIATAHNFQPLGDGWLEISAYDAHIVAAAVLQRDLAHDEEIMSRAEATELTEAFFDLAPEPHVYFTNGSWAELFDEDNESPSDNVSFDPISSATFDAGVICVGDGVTTILWVEDED